MSGGIISPEALQAVATLLETESGPGWHNVRLSNPQRLSTGWESDIVSVDASREVDGATRGCQLALRVYCEQGFAGGAAREPAAMQLLHRLGHPLPRVLAFDTQGTATGRPIVVMERVDGMPFSLAFDEAGALARSALAEALFGALVRLHHTDPEPLATLLGERVLPTSCHHTSLMLGQLARDLLPLCPKGLGAPMAWLVERLRSVSPLPPAVIHGDFHTNNVLVRAGGGITILDWSQVRVADPRYDVAWLSILSGGMSSAETARDIVSGYVSAGGAPLEDMDFFCVLAAFVRIMAISAIVTTGPKSVGLGEGAARGVAGGGEHFAELCALVFRHTGIGLPPLGELPPACGAAE